MADEEDAVAIVCALFLTEKKIRKTRKGDGQRGGDDASMDYTCYIMIWR